MTTQTERVYWDAMAALRKEGAALVYPKPAVAPVLKTSPHYLDAPVWMSFGITPTRDAALGYLFPKAYYEWCQRYVTTALKNKPASFGGSTTKAKVLWCLDILSHATWGMLALNTQEYGWGSYPYNSTRAGVAQPAPENGAFGTTQQYHFDGDIEVGSGGSQLRHPMPFAKLPFPSNRFLHHQEVDKIGGKGDAYPWPNTPLWSKFIAGVMPWYAGGYSLASFNNRDAKILNAAVAAKDEPLQQGILQWRMWAVQDFNWPKFWRMSKVYEPTFRFAGTPPLTSLLTDFITNTDSKTPMVAGDVATSGEIYPNFYSGFEEGVHHALIGFLQAGPYETAVSRYLLRWINMATPNPARAIVLGTYGEPVSGEPQPLTRDDFDSMEAASAKAIQARMLDEINNPQKYVPQNAQTATLWLQKHVGTFPGLAQIQQQLVKLAVFIGAAVGLDTLPLQYFAIPAPFLRTFAQLNYDTSAGGSSYGVLVRTVSAMLNLQSLTGLNFGLDANSVITHVNSDCVALVDLAYRQGDPKDVAVLHPGDRELLINACSAEFVDHSQPAGYSLKYLSSLLAQRHAEADAAMQAASLNPAIPGINPNSFLGRMLGGMFFWKPVSETLEDAARKVKR